MGECSPLSGSPADLPEISSLALDINEADQPIYPFPNQVRMLLPTPECLMLIQVTIIFL